ncbi:helix-turn-helix domain-containing protein [Alphaproteobacteria bacterium]|nr:helix-turn-helix domain-containing protein [Alphaproteobacteria bacterium]
MTPSPQTISLAMLILPNFNMMVTTGFLDPFRAANYLHGWRRYHWDFLALDPSQCTASNGMVLTQIKALRDATSQYNIVSVSASWTPDAFADRNILAWLRKQDRNGAMIGGIDTGAFILGYAGLLSEYQPVTHFEHHASFVETFPENTISHSPFSINNRRFSCGGGISAVELGLAILTSTEDTTMIEQIARYLYHHRHNQMPALPTGNAALSHETSLPHKLKKALLLMKEHIEEPISIPHLAGQLRISQRQLERDFRHHMQTTPKEVYLKLRLRQAQMMIRQTDLSILEIAVANGFSSQEHFSRLYKKTYHKTPTDDRYDSRIPFQFRSV